MQEYNLNAFDLVNVSFKTEASGERVQKAHEYAQSLYEELKVHGGTELLLKFSKSIFERENSWF